MPTLGFRSSVTTPKSSADNEELCLFPLHQENPTAPELDHDDKVDDDGVSWFLDPPEDAGTHMTSLLGESSPEDIPSSQIAAIVDVYAHDISGELAATALRKRVETTTWIFCPNRPTEDDAVRGRSSTAGYSSMWSYANCYGICDREKKDQEEVSSGGLSLKLDYDEILNDWSDKGSLYIEDRDSPRQFLSRISSPPTHPWKCCSMEEILHLGGCLKAVERAVAKGG